MFRSAAMGKMAMLSKTPLGLIYNESLYQELPNCIVGEFGGTANLSWRYETKYLLRTWLYCTKSGFLHRKNLQEEHKFEVRPFRTPPGIRFPNLNSPPHERYKRSPPSNGNRRQPQSSNVHNSNNSSSDPKIIHGLLYILHICSYSTWNKLQ